MKVTIDVDLTPEEARTLMGLPDLAPLHAIYVGKMEEVMTSGITPDMMEGMVRNWVPMGEAGMNLVQGLIGQFAGGLGGFGGGAGGGSSDKKKG